MRQDVYKYSYHGRRRFNADTHTLAAKESYKCRLCQEEHTYLLMCKHLLDYVPKQGSAKRLPESVCKTCLSTSSNPQKAPPNCYTNKYKFACEQSKMNNILCKCKEHKPIQQYLHSNYDPKLGKKNLVL